MGFGDKRLEWSVWCRIKEWTGDRNLGHILCSNWRPVFWPEFDKPNGLGSAAAAAGHLSRSAGIAHPRYLAIGCDEPPLAAPLVE
jgi:hypothetical protein